MSPLARRFLALFLSFFIGMVVMVAIEAVGMASFPAPSPFDPNDPAQLAAVMDQLPLGAKLSVVLGWILAPLAAGAVAGRVHPEGSPRDALAVGLGFTIMGVLNLLSVPHPWWMVIPGVGAYLPAAWAGDRIARRGGYSSDSQT
ncbi:MAG TPA: hypothetical protein PKA64_24490 [Myxococcota bacterium]|nr:hypothetical protein [Myxococcota bacterium]